MPYPLEQRIADGRRSVLFAHHADYAAGTIDEHPGKAISAFDRAPHYLLDTRLMLAWARALEETGQDDQARYVAARLKEFRNTDSDEFFAACSPEASRQRLRPASHPSSAWRRAARDWSYEDFR